MNTYEVELMRKDELQKRMRSYMNLGNELAARKNKKDRKEKEK